MGGEQGGGGETDGDREEFEWKKSWQMEMGNLYDEDNVVRESTRDRIIIREMRAEVQL